VRQAGGERAASRMRRGMVGPLRLTGRLVMVFSSRVLTRLSRSTSRRRGLLRSWHLPVSGSKNEPLTLVSARSDREQFSASGRECFARSQHGGTCGPDFWGGVRGARAWAVGGCLVVRRSVFDEDVWGGVTIEMARLEWRRGVVCSRGESLVREEVGAHWMHARLGTVLEQVIR